MSVAGGTVAPIRQPGTPEETLAWFRLTLLRPFDPEVVFDPLTIARAAEWPDVTPVGVAIREHVKSTGAPLRQWDSAVRAARAAAARERAERDRDSGPLTDDWRGQLLTDDGGRPRPSLGNAVAFLEHTHAHRLTFDEMADCPLLDGKPLKDKDIARVRIEIEHSEGIEIGKETATDAILTVAQSRSFHPVKDYLRALQWDGKKRVGSIAAEYLGADDKLSKVMVVRTLISAVARALNPGCQVDTALVFVGNEGTKKSTFFRTLGGMWFGDSTADIGDRKGVMVMKSKWIYEWAEVERVMLKKAESEVKAYVTQRDDTYVPMYGRGVVTSLRSNIILGSTNEDRFLTSSTGNRRWWVVKVSQRVDAVRLATERDQIWAEVVVLYDAFVRAKASGVEDDANPYKWWLSEEEEEQRKARNEDYQTVSADEQTVGAWLSGGPAKCSTCHGTGDGFGRDVTGSPHPCSTCKGSKVVERESFPQDAQGKTYVTIVDVLSGAMGIPLKEQTPSATQRATFTMRRLGWTSGKRFRVGGRNSNKVTPYYPPAGEEPANDAAPTVAPSTGCVMCARPFGKASEPGHCEPCRACGLCFYERGRPGACACDG